MEFSGVRDRLRKFTARIADAVAQDCPPELAACEVCRRVHCHTEEWLHCEKRIAAQRLLQAGDRCALEQLQRTHVGPAAPLPACCTEEVR